MGFYDEALAVWECDDDVLAQYGYHCGGYDDEVLTGRPANNYNPTGRLEF